MTLPGVEFQMNDTPAPRGPRLRLSTPFIVGELERGPEAAIAVRSMRDLQRLAGARTVYSAPTHDWLDAYFHERGGLAYVTPLRGPAAAAASATVPDSVPATALTITAREKGSWGNGAAGGLAYDIDVSGSNFEVKIYLNGVQIETSGMVADGAAAAAWAAASSRYVTITDGPGGDPVATGSPTNLTGGADDYGSIAVEHITAALARYTEAYGPGVIVLPGRTATDAHIAAAAAAEPKNRLVKADLVDTATVSTLTAAAATLRASEYADIIDILETRLTIPGLAGGTARTVPASYLRCAAEARNDAAGISPNQPAAGRWGISEYATAVSQEWSDDDRETLNDAGVNIVRLVDSDLRLYGSRTAVDPTTEEAAIRLGSARLRQAIREIARFEAESFAFGEVDQGGVELGNLSGRISGQIMVYEKSLYSLTVDAELLEDELQPGTYLVEITIVFQAAPDAERVRVVITRAVTEV